MNILIVTHDSLNGGTGRCAYELARLLKKTKGYNPIVVCHAENDLAKALREKSIETYSFRYGFTVSWKKNRFLSRIWTCFYGSFFNFLAYLKLKKKIKLEEVDVIHSNSSVVDFGRYLSEKLDKPHVWHIREFGDLDFELNYKKNIVSLLNKSANQRIVISDAVGKHWMKKGLIDCTMIYDGVNEFRTIRKKRGDDVKICMIGRISATKGQIFLLRALSKMPKVMQTRFVVDIYGSGRMLYINQMKKFISDNNLDGIVQLRGYVSDINERLADYDIGLNLSRAEGFGRTTVEYMMAGLYVIGFDGGATPEVLNFGACGKLLPYGKVSSLASALIDFCENQEKCVQIAMRGCNFAHENFCVEKNYKKIIDVYQKAFNEKR